jgi:hypothetical protein
MKNYLIFTIPFVLYSSASTAGLIAQGGATGPLFTNTPAMSSSSVGPITASLNESAVFQEGVSSATVLASTDYGYNKAAVWVNSWHLDTGATARSYWSDQVIVNSAMSGGYIRAGLDIRADLVLDVGPDLGGGVGAANSSVQYSLTGGGIEYSERFLIGSNGYVENVNSYSGGYEAIFSDLSSGDTFRKQVTIFIPFTSGVQFSLSSDLYCGAVAVQAQARCDAGNSVYWAGISDVLDMSGTSIQDWSIESVSGTDYARSFVPDPTSVPSSVPEPESMAILLAGLVGLAAARRRAIEG